MSPDRVAFYVSAAPREIWADFYRLAIVTVLPERAAGTMTSVEILRVCLLYPCDEGRQVIEDYFNEHVIMIRHQRPMVE
jgi:hypothetical protein